MGAIDEAIKNNCYLIISHHPITFHSYKNITNDINSKRIRKIIQNKINCYSIHSNFDLNIKNGMTKLVLNKLMFKNIKNVSYFNEFKYKNIKYGTGIIFELNKKINIQNIYELAIKKLKLDEKKTALYNVIDFTKNYKYYAWEWEIGG